MINDFKNWYYKKKHFIKHLREHNSIIISRVENVINVLEQIAKMDESEIDGDLDLIFDCGYSYLYSLIDEIELYLRKYFDDSLHQFLDYEPLINYAFYINELKEALIEQESFNSEASKEFSSVITDIEDILTYKKPFMDSKLEEFDARLLSTFVLKKEHLTTPEIFNQIAEELEIITDKKKFFSLKEEEQGIEHVHEHLKECDDDHEHEDEFQNTIKIDLN